MARTRPAVDDGPNSDPDLELPFEELAAREGLDDELLRQCGRLLAHEAQESPARRHRGPPARRVRDHLLVAKLAFEVDLLDRAFAEAHAALEVLPDDDEALRLLAAIHHRRGRLSDAVAIWTRLTSRPTSDQSALRELAQVFELSMQDPAHRDRYVPEALTASLEESLGDLEQSFRLAIGNNLAGALRAVERVAHRARGKDVHLLKVATIQRAWLLEQARDVPRAIVSLEALADVPGLTNDVERLLCLSTLYEREGTPERIRRAIRAVGYAYLSTRDPALLRRLARLLEELGHARLAERFEAHYEGLFRRRAHGLSARQMVRAMTLRFVPLERTKGLLAGRRAAATLLERHRARRRDDHRRRAAALAILVADLPLARQLLRSLHADGKATTVDRAYLAELDERLGDVEGARALRLTTLGAHASDAAALLSVLTSAATAGDVANELSAAELALAERALTMHARWNPSSAVGWRALAQVVAARGRAADAAAHAAHAAALEDALARPSPRVLAAAAIRRGGEVHGLMHEIWIDPRPASSTVVDGPSFESADVLGAVSQDLRAYAVNVFYTVLSYARAHYPHRLDAGAWRRFVLKFTKEDEPSSGESAGLPIAVAFFSALLGLTPPRDVAFSGAVVCDAHDIVVLRPVGDVEAKVEGAFERRVRRLILPADNRDDVERAERIPREIGRTLVTYAATFDEVCADLFPNLT